MSLTYIILALTVTIFIFCRNKSFLYTLLLVATWVALDQHLINHEGIFALAALALLTYTTYNLPISKALQKILLVVMAILVGELILHNVAGFYNHIIENKVILSPGAHPYSMYFNLDKIFAGLIIYAFSNLASAEKAIDEKSLIQAVLIYLACVIVIMCPAILSGYVKFAPKISALMPLWIINNLLFVCFSEEVIFRGFLQNTILSWMPKKTVYTALGIVITSIIFGLYHYKDGVIFIGLAAICGLFYGYTYFKTKRILCAMLVHFLLNLTHIVLFSYPSAA